jgi:hypothetical protein
VREGLGEVAELLARRADLLRVQPDVVGVGEHLLEGQPRLVESPGPGERLHPPEGAQREGRLLAGEPVGRRVHVVAVDAAVGDRLRGDRVERGDPAQVGGRDELAQGHEQQRGVEHVGVAVLHERQAVPAARHDLVVDAVPNRHPAGDVGGQAALAGDPDRALDRDPAHQPRVRVVPAAAARLPDPIVGLVPVLDQPLEVARDLDPGLLGEPEA